jgi:type I restriction enzyme S subunit
MRIVLPDNWKWKELRTVARIEMGQSPPGTSYNTLDDGVPFLQGKAEFGNEIPVHVKSTNKPCKVIGPGTILMSVRAPVGDVNIADQEYCIGRGLAGIVSKECDNRYLFYYLASIRSLVESKGTGSTFKAISKSIIEGLSIPLPPLNTQRKIVAILDKAEETRRMRARANELTQRLLKSVFLEKFGDPVTNPKGWETRRMKEVCSKITDGTHDTPKPTPTGVPFITARHIHDRRIDFENCLFLPTKVHEVIYKRCNPTRGDVTFVNIGANIGSTAYVDVDFEFSLKNVALLKPSGRILEGRFLESYLFHLRPLVCQITSRGGAQAFISLSQIDDLSCMLPPLPLQEQFARIVESQSAIEKKQTTATTKVELNLEVLIDKAFAGELVA